MEQPMSTIEIGQKLAELCRQGRNLDALNTLFADELVSVEAGAPPGMEREANGLPAVKAKATWWMENHEIHSATVTGPWPHDNKFILGFQYDVTNKPSGQRMKMDEVALYYVSNGKIVREEFFYSMGM
jgi:ketosteroid isomerase-like protein